SLLRLDGGILGRSDDMIHLRGNNFFPGSLENVLRRLVDVAEYRAEVIQNGSLATLRIEGEAAPAAGAAAGIDRVSRAVGDTFLFRAEVAAVAPGSLPRFEMKARRVTVKKN